MKCSFGCWAISALLFFVANLAQADLLQRRMELIDKYIDEAAANEHLDPALIRAVIRVESNYNHKAVSRAGARGLMQLMPPTAAQLGFSRALDHKDPRSNVLAGTRYLREMLNEFEGNITLAVAAYNAGPRAVKQYRNQIPPYRETQNYVTKVFKQFKIEQSRVARM
jgi:soluble lytic murein transglycosylase-like protein